MNQQNKQTIPLQSQHNPLQNQQSTINLPQQAISNLPQQSISNLPQQSIINLPQQQLSPFNDLSDGTSNTAQIQQPKINLQKNMNIPIQNDNQIIISINKHQAIFKQQRQQIFNYIEFSKRKLDIIRQSYQLKIQKCIKQGHLINKIQPDLNLQILKVSIALTANISILKHKIANQQWTMLDNTQNRLWVCKYSLSIFQQHLKSHIKGTVKTFDYSMLIPIDNLHNWYTLAHFKARFSQMFFIFEKKQPNNFMFPFQKPKCSFCQSNDHTLCLCGQFNICNICSNEPNAIYHQSICKYAIQVICTNLPMKISTFTRMGLIPMKNPHNLCYLNTALQCLLAVRSLTDYFLENQYIKDLNMENPEGTFGDMAIRYADLVRYAWCQKSIVYDSNIFKKSLARFHQDFLNVQQQQDSQQCLSVILNCLKADLNRILTPPPYQQISYLGSEEQQAKQAWDNHISRNFSIVEDLMTGLIKSHIKCLGCGFNSYSFDPFICLPLPIASPKQIIQKKIFGIYFFSLNCKQKNKFFNIQLQRYHLDELNKKTRQLLNIKNYRQFAFYLLSQTTIQRITNKTDISRIIQIVQKGQKCFCCLEYPQQQLASNMLQISFIVKQRDLKLETYKIIGLKRPLFFNKANRPKQGRQLFKKILLFFYPAIFQNPNKINQQQYLQKYLKSQNIPFKMFFTNQSNNQGFFQIYIDDQVKITKDTEIIVQFQQNHLFKLDLLSATLKHPNADLKNIQKKQVKIRRPATIYDCLDQFRKSDRIAEWRCSECRNEGGQKKMTIYNAPRVLIVYLKRFQSNISADGNSIIQNKISDIVKFQPHLYLQKYVEKQQLPMWKGSHLLNYRLVSVANHMQLNSKKVQLGHYYAFVVNRHSWYLCNDESIQELQNLDYLSSGEAYYMIYQRIM